MSRLFLGMKTLDHFPFFPQCCPAWLQGMKSQHLSNCIHWFYRFLTNSALNKPSEYCSSATDDHLTTRPSFRKSFYVSSHRRLSCSSAYSIANARFIPLLETAQPHFAPLQALQFSIRCPVDICIRTSPASLQSYKYKTLALLNWFCRSISAPHRGCQFSRVLLT